MSRFGKKRSPSRERERLKRWKRGKGKKHARRPKATMKLSDLLGLPWWAVPLAILAGVKIENKEANVSEPAISPCDCGYGAAGVYSAEAAKTCPVHALRFKVGDLVRDVRTGKVWLVTDADPNRVGTPYSAALAYGLRPNARASADVLEPATGVRVGDRVRGPDWVSRKGVYDVTYRSDSCCRLSNEMTLHTSSLELVAHDEPLTTVEDKEAGDLRYRLAEAESRAKRFAEEAERNLHWRAQTEGARAELALEREHVDRLKLALAQALPPRPPASAPLPERAIRASLDAWESRVAPILERAAQSARTAVAWGAVPLVAAWALARDTWRWVYPDRPHVGIPMISIPLAALLLWATGSFVQRAIPPAPVMPHLSLAVAPVDSPAGANLAFADTAPIASSATWGWSMTYSESDLPCPRCGQKVEGRTLLAFYLGSECFGTPTLRSCLRCMLRDLALIDRLRPPTGGGIVLGTYFVKAGTTFVVDGPVEGVALVSSGDASVLVERRCR